MIVVECNAQGGYIFSIDAARHVLEIAGHSGHAAPQVHGDLLAGKRRKFGGAHVDFRRVDAVARLSLSQLGLGLAQSGLSYFNGSGEAVHCLGILAQAHGQQGVAHIVEEVFVLYLVRHLTILRCYRQFTAEILAPAHIFTRHTGGFAARALKDVEEDVRGVLLADVHTLRLRGINDVGRASGGRLCLVVYAECDGQAACSLRRAGVQPFVAAATRQQQGREGTAGQRPYECSYSLHGWLCYVVVNRSSFFVMPARVQFFSRQKRPAWVPSVPRST